MDSNARYRRGVKDLPQKVSVAQSIHEIPAGDWDALVGHDNPFVEHAFLAALEDSGSLGANTGWLPAHVVVRAAEEPEASGATPKLVAATPSYVRTNSYGEYIFDWAWADGARRGGLRYYPKVTTAVPFTPATGPRLLVHPQVDEESHRALLGEALLGLAQASESSSVHVLFCSEQEARALAPLGYLPRRSYQFHWHNEGWADFQDYMRSLRRKRRGEIGRERRRLRDHGVSLQLLRGDEITQEHWALVDRLYRHTVRKRGGMPYLEPAFFLEQAPHRLAERAVVVLAHRGSQWIGASLSFRRGSHLYGRYAGSLEPIPGLHFELCYYALIEHAIQEKLSLFEAGAQGRHKLSRGLVPRSTWSAHWIRHPGLRDAIEEYVRVEGREVERDMESLGQRSPFREASLRS